MRKYYVEYNKRNETKHYGIVDSKNRYEAVGIAIDELIPKTENALDYEIKVIGYITRNGVEPLIKR